MNKTIFQTGGTIARWIVGLLFIYFGLSKVLQPVEFLKLARQYDLVQTPWLLNTLAATLPWFEIICGVLLLLGVAVRGTSLVLILMLIPFTVLVSFRAAQISAAAAIPFCMVKFDCGCGAGEVLICFKIVENMFLVLGSLWLLAGSGKPLALAYCFPWQDYGSRRRSRH